MDLKNSDGLVYHMKLFGNKVIYVKNTKHVMVLDTDSLDLKYLGKSENQILALHVYGTTITNYDMEILKREGAETPDQDEESKMDNWTD